MIRLFVSQHYWLVCAGLTGLSVPALLKLGEDLSVQTSCRSPCPPHWCVSVCVYSTSPCVKSLLSLTDVWCCGGKLCPPVVIKHAGPSAEPCLPSDRWIIAQSEATESLKWLPRVCPVKSSLRKAWSPPEKRNHRRDETQHRSSWNHVNSDVLQKSCLC